VSFALRPAAPADAEALSRLASESFIAAFGHLYRPEDLQAFLHAHRSPDRFHEQLAKPEIRVQLAEDGDDLVGYCLLVRGSGFDERPAPRPERPVYLSELYCAPAATGRGVGAALMDWAIAQACEWSADALQLSVFSGNVGAQRFYRRYGFAHVADIDFWVGNHRDDEFLFELRLADRGS
jgi:ribosomal protein S18 acetylase RimI-like enzyme